MKSRAKSQPGVSYTLAEAQALYDTTGEHLAERLFPPGVVYMPVPRCDQCRSWERDEKGKPLFLEDRSLCSNDGRGSIDSGDEGALSTRADFGCVEFTAKGK